MANGLAPVCGMLADPVPVVVVLLVWPLWSVLVLAAGVLAAGAGVLVGVELCPSCANVAVLALLAVV